MYAYADGTRLYSLKYSALRLPSLLPLTAGFTGFTAVFFYWLFKDLRRVYFLLLPK